MKIATVCIDLAKNVLQIHGVDQSGKAVLKKQLKRNQVLEFFANMEQCLIGMEACAVSVRESPSLPDVFAVVKRLWGFDKVRYRGLAKNATRAFVTLAMANIYLARQPLLAQVRA